MSGHLQDGDEPDLLRHTGLSYLTRSTSILALIELARGARFTRAAPEDALA